MEKEHLEMILEDINGKFDLLLEGHAGIREEIRELGRKTDERFDLVDFKIDVLNQKVDAVRTELKEDIRSVDKKVAGVAADLQAHRADTEVHRGYQVRED